MLVNTRPTEMPYRSFISLSPCAWLCLSLVVNHLVVSQDAVSGVYSVKYTCSKWSLPASSNSIPLIQKARSGLECSRACSRRDWCSRYSITPDANDTSYDCSLHTHESLLSSVHTPAALGITTCEKVIDQSEHTSVSCAVTPLPVLDVEDMEATLTTDFVYLRNLLAAGNDLTILYDMGTTKYVTSANYVTAGNGSSEVCATIVDSDEPSNNTAVLLFVREFCTKSQPHPPIASPVFSWKVQKKNNNNHLGSNNIVFTTGGNTSYLEATLNNGSEIKIVTKGDYSVMRAEIISQSEDRCNQIVAQTTLFEDGKYKILSFYTTQQEKTVLLDLSLSNFNKPSTQKDDVIWLSDPCWKHVHTTTPHPPASGPSLNMLLSAIDEGRRIRLKFIIDKLVILATPDFVGVDQYKTVIVHVLRVLTQESFLGNLVKLPSLTNQSPWAHYYITSHGNINLIRSSQMTPLTDKAYIQWYTEAQNYTIAYTSSSRNLTSLARLVTNVFEGKNVRVRIHNGTNRMFYPCHTIQVVQNGQEVKCQVNGQLGVELLGPKITRSINLASILPPILSALVGLTTTTGCFQSVVVLAFQGSIDYFLSCPGPSNSSQVRIKQPQEVDWFVAE